MFYISSESCLEVRVVLAPRAAAAAVPVVDEHRVAIQEVVRHRLEAVVAVEARPQSTNTGSMSEI